MIIIRTSRSTGETSEHSLDDAVRRILSSGEHRTETTVRRDLLDDIVIETFAAYYHLKIDTEKPWP